MTKNEARKAIKLLEANGCHDVTMIKFAAGVWRVYATDNASGYRFHDDDLTRTQERIDDRAARMAGIV